MPLGKGGRSHLATPITNYTRRLLRVGCGLLTFRPSLTLSMRRPLRGDNHAGDVRLEYSNLVVAWALS